MCNIEEDGITKEIYFEVDKEYGKYLCYERCDAFVIGLLNYALRNNHDIKSKTPMTDELLYNINEYLIPSLVKNDEKLFNIRITVPTASALQNAGAVGTGLSCGVDSFHAVINNINSPYKDCQLTHVCINNVGSFNNIYSDCGIENVRQAIYKRAKSVANELNIPLIETDSNIRFQIDQRHGLTHTYSSMFAVFCMQKLWKTYFYASTHRIETFSLKNNSIVDPSLYELLSLNCFSNRNLRIYSEGMAKTRVEKTEFIADNKIAQKYLHVCLSKDENCGVCNKCRRTLTTLDALGKLDKFSEVFDIEYYKKHKFEYLCWLYKNVLNKNDFGLRIFERMKNKIPFYIKLIEVLNFYNIVGYDIICRKTKRNKIRLKILGIKVTI